MGADRPAVEALDTDAALERAERWLKDGAPLAVEGQGGDAITFRVAATLKDYGVSEYAAWDLMLDHWSDRCSPPWSPEELTTKVANAYLYGLSAPGSQSPEVDFKGIDIPPPPRTKRSWSYHGDAPILEGSWLLHETLPSVGTLLVVGPSQAGKTFLLTELARCVAAGEAFFDVVPEERGAVLMVFAGTEGAGIQNRMAALGEETRLPIAYTDGVYLRKEDAVIELAKDLKEQSAAMLAHFGVPIRMVVLETISASGLIEKENDSDSVTSALVTLGRLAKELGVLFATSHHPPKDGDGPRGSGAFTAVVDSEIAIRREPMHPIRVVELTKARNAPQRKLGSFTLLPVELGRDAKDRPVVSMKLSMAAGVVPSFKAEYASILVRCLEVDAKRLGQELEDGRWGLPLMEFRTSFEEATPDLSRDKRPSIFTRAMADASDAGAVEKIDQGSRKFFVLKEITDATE